MGSLPFCCVQSHNMGSLPRVSMSGWTIVWILSNLKNGEVLAAGELHETLVGGGSEGEQRGEVAEIMLHMLFLIYKYCLFIIITLDMYLLLWWCCYHPGATKLCWCLTSIPNRSITCGVGRVIGNAMQQHNTCRGSNVICNAMQHRS